MLRARSLLITHGYCASSIAANQTFFAQIASSMLTPDGPAFDEQRKQAWRGPQYCSQRPIPEQRILPLCPRLPTENGDSEYVRLVNHEAVGKRNLIGETSAPGCCGCASAVLVPGSRADESMPRLDHLGFWIEQAGSRRGLSARTLAHRTFKTGVIPNPDASQWGRITNSYGL